MAVWASRDRQLLAALAVAGDDLSLTQSTSVPSSPITHLISGPVQCYLRRHMEAPDRRGHAQANLQAMDSPTLGAWTMSRGAANSSVIGECLRPLRSSLQPRRPAAATGGIFSAGWWPGIHFLVMVAGKVRCGGGIAAAAVYLYPSPRE